MGEAQSTLFRPNFNRAVRVEPARSELSADAGALITRQAAEHLGVQGVLAGLRDNRNPWLVRYPLVDLVLGKVLLTGQGWHDQDDFDNLRDDPVLRVSVNGRRGQAVWTRPLPSQPTVCRQLENLGMDDNLAVLDRGLLEVGFRRARDDADRSDRFFVDFDSYPTEVHGKQEGSSYNGHYGQDCFHPLVAIAGTGDVLAVEVRPGNVHTAHEVRPFIAPVLAEAVERYDDVWARFDAGFASGDFFDWLDARGVRFITRLKTNSILTRRVANWKEKIVDKWRRTHVPGQEAREATYEFYYKAGSWSKRRRVVAVLVEATDRNGELFDNLFFLCTSGTRPEATSADILRLYRHRGRAENTIGEFVNGYAPNLSSPSLAVNQATLRLAALAYNVVHFVRRRLEKLTGRGLSLRRLREQVLKTAARLVRHARRLVFRISPGAIDTWRQLAHILAPDPDVALQKEVPA